MAPSGGGVARVSVATWNLLFRPAGEGAARRKLGYLAQGRWDIACLQELNPATSKLIRDDYRWDFVNGLELSYEHVGHWKYPHASAIVARNGWRLNGGVLVAETPTPGRGVAASAVKDDISFTVMSWHAPYATRGLIAHKMDGYRAIVAAIQQVGGPLVVGLDSNHWSPGNELDLPEPPAAGDRYENEKRFFSRVPGHRLRDAFIQYLRRNPAVYEDAVRSRPNGPLAVTYIRAGTEDRFDYIFTSEDFVPVDMTHDYDGAERAGSDHALVVADLESFTGAPRPAR
jgi:endonuclease/exonuclease/phosphatase family metal-dependent hydrolase